MTSMGRLITLPPYFIQYYNGTLMKTSWSLFEKRCFIRVNRSLKVKCDGEQETTKPSCFDQMIGEEDAIMESVRSIQNEMNY